MSRRKFGSEESYKKYKKKERARYYGASSFIYPKRPWRPDEDTIVLEHEYPDTELSTLLHRSVKAIQHRRHRLLNDFE